MKRMLGWWSAGVVLGMQAAGVYAAEQLRFPPPEFEGEYKLPEIVTPSPRAAWWELIDICVLVLALALTGWFVFKKRSRRGVIGLSLFSLVYFGFVRGGCLCVIGSGQNVLFGLFHPEYWIPLMALAFFLIPVAVALFAGRLFCAAVCPHGALQELVLVRPVRIPTWLEQILGLIPFIFLGAGLLFAATGAGFLFCRWDPFVTLFRLNGNMSAVIYSLMFLILAMFVGRPFCRFLCPYGALLRIASVFARWRVRITPSTCTECRLCEEACPYGAIREPTKWSAEPVRVRKDRARLLILSGLLPVWIIAGAVAGRQAAPVLAWLNSDVRWTAMYASGTRASDFEDPTSVDAKAMQRLEKERPEALERMKILRERLALGGWWFGAWIGLIIGGRLVVLALRPAYREFEPQRSVCFACGRCYVSCPNERIRLGLEPPWYWEEFYRRQEEARRGSQQSSSSK